MNNDFLVTRENHWQITSLVTKKSLLMVTHALFFIFYYSNGNTIASYGLATTVYDEMVLV